MSRRSDVISEVITRLKINIEQTYRDREGFSEDDQFPIANVLIGESKAVQAIPNTHVYETALPISIEAINKETSEDYFDEIESLLSEIKSSLLVDNTLNRLCKNFTFDGDSEAGRQYGGSFVSVSADFTFNYVENHCKEE